MIPRIYLLWSPIYFSSEWFLNMNVSSTKAVQRKRLSCSSNGKIVPFLVLISNSLPNKTSLSAALSLNNESKFLELSGTSNAFDNLIFRPDSFESAVLISIVPLPSIELVLLFALIIIPVYSLSIPMNKLSSLFIWLFAPESNTSSQAGLLLGVWKNEKYSSHSAFGSSAKLWDPDWIFWLNFLLWLANFFSCFCFLQNLEMWPCSPHLMAAPLFVLYLPS